MHTDRRHLHIDIDIVGAERPAFPHGADTARGGRFGVHLVMFPGNDQPAGAVVIQIGVKFRAEIKPPGRVNLFMQGAGKPEYGRLVVFGDIGHGMGDMFKPGRHAIKRAMRFQVV